MVNENQTSRLFIHFVLMRINTSDISCIPMGGLCNAAMPLIESDDDVW